MFWVFIIFLILFLFGMAVGAKSLAPWVPTRRRDLTRVVELPELQPVKKIIDIGCGTGQVVAAIAASHPQMQCIGVEISWPLFLFAWLRTRRRHNAYVLFGDLFKKDLSAYDAIFVYGIPGSIKRRLTDKLQHECRSGTLLISYIFKFPKLNLLRMEKPTNHDASIYLYRL